MDIRNAVFGSLLALAVLVVAAVDVERFEIPDLANLTILLLGLAWQAWDLNSDEIFAALLRGVAAAALLLGVRGIYRQVRKVEGLGLGDVKLAAAGAIWLSWADMWLALCIAVLGALMVVGGRRLVLREAIGHDTALPFGAFLAPAIWCAWVAGSGP